MADIYPIQIIYAPGTFGNALRWVFDRFSKGSKFKDLFSPWDNDGRAHGFKEDDYNQKFIRGHQLDGRWDSPNPNAFHVVLYFDPADLVFIERCGFYRNPGYETDGKRYEQIIARADQKFVTDTFGKSVSKCVAKELYKIQFHDTQNHAWWNSMNQHMNDTNAFQFNLYTMFDEAKFENEIIRTSNKLDLDLQIDRNVVKNVVDHVNNSYVVKTKDRAIKALDAVVANKDVPCDDFDIVEQAFIESELEKVNDNVLFPYGQNWFTNTSDINDFITTYPTYLKHMNPRLPWYNNIKNPFYLTGRING